MIRSGISSPTPFLLNKLNPNACTHSLHLPFPTHVVVSALAGLSDL